MLNEFTTEDLSFMVGRDEKKVSDLIEASKKFKSEYPNLSDIDFFDKICDNRGVEIYNRLSKHRIESKEYLNVVSFISNNKTINVNSKEGKDVHIFRNKNQYKKGPKDLKTMWKFVKKGLYIFEGFAPCHNVILDDVDNRKKTLNETLYLISNNLMTKKNKFAALENVSFRGTPGTDFEGCQFVYNYDTGAMVIDNVNRGTWDFGMFGTPTHMYLDVLPWIKIGNGENKETKNMFVMSDVDAKKILEADHTKSIINVDPSKPTIVKKIYKDMVYHITNFFRNGEVEQTAEEYYRDEKANKLEAASNFITHYIKNIIDNKLTFCYSNDWKNYVSFCNVVKNRDIINGLVKYIRYIDTNPTNIEEKTDTATELDYMEKLMVSSIVTKFDEYRTSGVTIRNRLPMKIKVTFSPSIVESIDKSYEISDGSGLNKHSYYSSMLIHEMNKRISKYKIILKMDRKVEFDKENFTIKVYQMRKIGDLEAKLASKDEVSKYIEKYNSIK